MASGEAGARETPHPEGACKAKDGGAVAGANEPARKARKKAATARDSEWGETCSGNAIDIVSRQHKPKRSE